MKSFIVIISLFLTAALFAVKPLPPGSGVNVKANVLFVIDNSGSMGGYAANCVLPNDAFLKNKTGNYFKSPGNYEDSRICHTMNALLMLLNQASLTSSIRMGLSVFPLGGSNGTSASSNQVLVSVKNTDDAHLDDLRAKVKALTIPNGTPIGEALRGAGWYFQGLGTSKHVCYGSVDCTSPIVDRCQKNYVILFTDGDANNNVFARNQSLALNTTGFLGTINSFVMANTKVPTYAIGFAGANFTNLNLIASNGGTNQAYNTGNQTELLTAFTSIINDITAKSITSATPTVIPNFVGDEGVLYQAQFKPRQDKQWEGHFFKYLLDDDGFVNSVPEWDVNQKMPLSKDRNIYTVCRNKDNTQTVYEFTPENAETLDDCIVVNGEIGAGNPVEVCNTTNFNWLGDNVVNWKPPRTPVTYQCLNNFRSQIEANIGNYEYLCFMSGFANYSGGSCNGQSTQNKAELIERYLCQYNHTCDCYSDWLGLSGATNTVVCNSSNATQICVNPNPTLLAGSSCVDGHCVGKVIYQNDPAVWLTIDDGKYDHNLNTTTTFGDAGLGAGFIELTMKDLVFADGSGGGTYKDYFSIRTVNPQRYFIVVSEQNGPDGVIYDCGASAPTGHGAIIQLVGCSALAQGDTAINGYGTVSLTRNGNDAVLALPASSVSVLFKSDNSLNDIALIVQKWRNKRAPEITCHWEEGGAGTPLASVIEDTKKLINFFRGKDAYGEDSTLANPLDCSKDRALLNDTNCKERLYKLSDIFNSRAKFFGKPHQSYVYADYKTFQNTRGISRAGKERLLIGSNGGMLHAIDIGTGSATTGTEKWAFIPPNLLPYLKKVLTNDPNKTSSSMFVDRSPKIMDIYNPATTSAIPEVGWRSIALITFGEGGYGIMALDITEVDDPKFLWAVYNESPLIPLSALFQSIGIAGGADPNFRNARRVLKWDYQGGITAYYKNVKVIPTDLDVPTQYDYTDLAETWSEPVFGQVLSRGTDPISTVMGTPAAVFGSGGLQEDIPLTGGTTFGSVVYVINPLTGVILKSFKLPNAANNVAVRTPANIAVLPRYKSSGVENRIMDLLYVTDLAGRLWKLNPNDTTSVTQCDLSNTTAANASADDKPCQLIFNGNATLTNKDFMYYGPAITYDKQPSEKEATLWAYMGTGNSDIYDITNNEGNNYLYAVRDYTWSDGNWRNSNNQASTLTYPFVKPTASTSGFPEINSTFTPNSAQCNSSVEKGWYYRLGQGTGMSGEKLVGEPTIIDGYVYFVTYVHGTNSGGDCGGALGTSYVYSFELFTGCFNPAFKSDINGNDSTAQARAILGRGVATSPVMRGKSMYFGISGEADAGDTPIFGQATRQGNLIKWDRGTPSSTKSSDVPFSFFREIF